MKKSLFFFAAAALALTACTSDNDVVQSASQMQQSGPQAIAFDTYTAGTTRAGAPEGVMTTDKLKTTGMGFGVFAFYHDNTNWEGNGATLEPNFMFNEHISWLGGWTYSPLKYWPNETLNDSQDPNAVMPGASPYDTGTYLDKLSFFAYAPYVSTGATNTLATKATNMETNRTATAKKSAYEAATATDNQYGILRVSAEDLQGDPLVEWKAYTNLVAPLPIDPWNTILDHNVDLLWGVASADADYTAVNGKLVDTSFGLPLKDLVKPDKDQRVKFLFQHALSRIGLTVVSAIDQIAGGDDGNKFNSAQTRVLIEDVKVWGNFGIQGVLNLDNTTENKANWIWTSVDRTPSTEAAPILLVDKTNGYLAADLRYDDAVITAIEGGSKHLVDLNSGVLPSEQSLLAGGPDPSKKVAEASPEFAYDKVLYVLDGADYVIAKTKASEAVDAYTKSGDTYTQVFTTSAGSKADLSGKSAKHYKVSATTALSNGDVLADGVVYYVKTGSAGNWIYTKATGDGVATADADDKYYTDFAATELSGDAYSSDEYYTALMPRYFMVIPTEDGQKTDVYVKITYRIITEDAKLGTTISNIQSVVTKKEGFTFEDGKSYNLKLILGLTSVKLDATVGEWQVGDDAEIWLPKNVE